MKQTAVQFLLENIVITSSKNLVSVIKQAIKMENQQQDDFAIAFAEWKERNAMQNEDGLYYGESRIQVSRKNPITLKELLEIYKKEKGL
jgi:hypothetical protein